jgi:ubiquinone/menaquinone biosynthesis C-methylase UbiE
MRINLGAGDKYWPGFVNCDAYSDVDVRCEAYPMPFATDSADELWAIHLLEHLHRKDVGAALTEWFRVLKQGGRLVLELPSLDKIAQLIVLGEKNLRMTVMGLFGDPRDEKPGMMHHWAWSQAELIEVLTGVGFERVTFPDPAFHILERDQRVEAYKPC